MAAYWRVFPWDPGAAEGYPFSASHVPATTGRGRFDLPVDRSPVLYVAESPEHAIAEALQPWRNRRLCEAHLERAGRPLAIARLHTESRDQLSILDLCDPATLVDLGIGPDLVASRHRDRTQPIAARAWEDGYAGLRWWSAFWGDWHGAVLFTDRIGGRVSIDAPEVLTPDAPAVRSATDALGMA